MDTIFALATARGRAGIAVIRLSGPAAKAASARLVSTLPASRGLRAVRDDGGGLIDQALVLVFDGPRSFTGEEVVEFHLHGSPAVTAAVLKQLGRESGLRAAEAGEFTRRALENGRLDLAQVEGLADLVEAETEAQRRQAIQVFSGALGRKAERWRASLIRAAALVEATIDFADEDVPVNVAPEVGVLIAHVAEDLRIEAAGVQIAERLREGFEVAIVGPPNVGKSTLLNRLAGREAAITSEIAGTTRDVIEVRMDLAGLPVTVLDTAGLRESRDQVERLGIERARGRAREADLRVHLVEGDGKPELPPKPEDIVVQAKADLCGAGVSGLTGQGVDDLVERIGAILEARVARTGVAMRERHRDAMLRAVSSLEAAASLLPALSEQTDLLAEHLRDAARAIDSLVGRVDVEDVLDEIFASFCIGK